MEIILPMFQVFTALGLVLFYQWIRPHYRKFVPLFLIPIAVFFVGLYLHNYYRIAPLVSADAWQYGYKQAVTFAQTHSRNIDKVIVSTHLRQPQNFFAFYTAYDPETYVEVDGGTVSGGFDETRNKFGKFAFHPISWNPNDLEKRVLYIDMAEDVPTSIVPTKTIYLPSGKPTIVLYEQQ
jgi:hypothetical protein